MSVTPSDKKALTWLAGTLMFAGGLGLLMPYVALGLVIAYAATGMSAGLRIFMGFVAVATLASAAAQGLRLWFTVKGGRFGKTLRAEKPRRFWAWITVSGLMFAIYGAAGIYLLVFAVTPTLIAF